MANRNKNKGTYHEKWFVNWLNEIKAPIKAKRQPLSGSLGGEYPQTLVIMSGDEFQQLMEKANGNAEQNDKGSP